MPAMLASQTIGPFWHLLADPAEADLTRFGAASATGQPLVLTGQVTDGDGALISDACIEIWQASPAASPSFPGWGRCATDARGEFRFATLAPDPAAPYIAVVVLARGLVKPLWTRVYFADLAGAPGGPGVDDPLLAALPPERRATLLAARVGAAERGEWRWDIRLQGERETVFLAL
jgi:protocatechuate 3,4-dioxygenase alpha subunit